MPEKRKLTPHASFRNSGFVIVSTFDIRASSFPQAAICASIVPV
jgi:hypothetical protein